MQKRFKNKGFSLMELILSIGIISTVLTGAISLISMSFSTAQIGKSRVIALGLVQEGLEIARNIRDNNWLAGKRDAGSWRDGLGSTESQQPWRVQYNSLSLLSPATGLPLKINTNGFYQYNSGTDTVFYRNIDIEYIDNNEIKVTCQVDWRAGKRSGSVNAETILYNWLEPQE